MARLQLRLQHLALAVDHIQVAHLPFLVLRLRQMRSTLRCVHRIVLRLNLIVEQAQIREVVLDFLERHQHLLAILRHVFVILAVRLSQVRLAPATVEQRQRQRRTGKRPQQERAARPHEQVAQRRRLVTESPRDIELREERRLRQTDPRIGRGHGALGGRHVRAAFEQRRGQPRRHAGRHRHERRFREREVRRRLAKQDREAMLGGSALPRHANRIGPRARQFVACLRQIQFADIALVKAALDQLQRILAQRHRLAIQVLIGIEFAQLEVVLRHIGLQRELHRAEQRFALLRIGLGCIHVRTDPAEQIRLVRHGPLRTPQRGGFRTAALRQELRGGRHGLARRAKARIELREPVGACRLHRRPRLLHSRRGRFQVLVSGSGLLFQVVERRVAKNPPPFAAVRVVRRLRRFPCAGLLRCDHRRLLEGRRRFDVGTLVGRLDRAGGEQRQQQAARCGAAPATQRLNLLHYCFPLQASVTGNA